MFSNFVTFTEVVRLSSNVFYSLREVNYHDKLLNLIYFRKDIITFEEVLELVEDKYLITKFIKFTLFTNNELKWLINIVKVKEYIDITAYAYVKIKRLNQKKQRNVSNMIQTFNFHTEFPRLLDLVYLPWLITTGGRPQFVLYLIRLSK